MYRSKNIMEYFEFFIETQNQEEFPNLPIELQGEDLITYLPKKKRK